MHRWKQNIAIAEATGWERGPAKTSVCGGNFLTAGQYWHRKEDKDSWQDCCPNFVESLDEMHNALNTMTDEQWYSWFDFMGKITGYETPVPPIDYTERINIQKSTAAQQAEGFLKVLGLWLYNDPDDESTS